MTRPNPWIDLGRMQQLLDNSDEFASRSRFADATFTFVIPEAVHTYRLIPGRVVRIEAGQPMTGADFWITGSAEAWMPLIRGQMHLLQATNPFHGGLRVDGDMVLFAGHMRPVFFIGQTLQKAATDG